VEVFTDKLVAKIPSTCTGTVKEISYEVDDVCLVGHTLIRIEVDGEGEDDAVDTSDSSSSSEEETAAVTRSSSGIQSGPGKWKLTSFQISTSRRSSFCASKQY